LIESSKHPAESQPLYTDTVDGPARTEVAKTSVEIKGMAAANIVAAIRGILRAEGLWERRKAGEMKDKGSCQTSVLSLSLSKPPS